MTPWLISRAWGRTLDTWHSAPGTLMFSLSAAYSWLILESAGTWDRVAKRVVVSKRNSGKHLAGTLTLLVSSWASCFRERLLREPWLTFDHNFRAMEGNIKVTTSPIFLKDLCGRMLINSFDDSWWGVLSDTGWRKTSEVGRPSPLSTLKI